MVEEAGTPSVLGGLPTFAWDAEAAVRFEVAGEAINQAVAAYTALIGQAREAGQGERVGELIERRRACSRALDELRGHDTEVVDEAIRTYGQLTQELRAQAR